MMTQNDAAMTLEPNFSSPDQADNAHLLGPTLAISRPFCGEVKCML